VTGALTLLFACLQVAGAASEAADRALARCMLAGLHLPLRSALPTPVPDSVRSDGV
jgi:hypothetical protein